MKDIQFHYTSLFGQDLSNLEPILRITSCMNPDDGELIGFMQIAILRSKERKQNARVQRLEAKSEQLQVLGMSRWVKGELTHLALRLGHRNKQTIDLSSDAEDVEPDATATS